MGEYNAVFKPSSGMTTETVYDAVKTRKPYRTVGDHTARLGLFSVTVPHGFGNDRASFRWLRPFFPPWALILIDVAAVFHDYIYRVQPCDRVFGDAFFLALMRRFGVPFFWRSVCYWVVRLFGWHAWRRNKQHVAEERRRLGFNEELEGFCRPPWSEQR